MTDFDSNEVEKAKKVAIQHYKTLMENNKNEWLKTIKKLSLKSAERYWWPTGRKRVDEQKMSYEFKNFDEKYSSPTRLKFFFHRLDKDGKPSGSGQVPAIMVKDKDNKDEWRVDTGSY